MFTTKLKNWFEKIVGKSGKIDFSHRVTKDNGLWTAPEVSTYSMALVINGKVLTTGHIANLLNVPVHKIKYQITTLEIEHIAMAGDRRVFSQSALDKLTKIFEAKAS